ncbi:ABATE domain-containing protein [Streptomyces sp. NPDC097619]|uniref:CGNR zinc finger domain-containing protein n=1 Tax=Streptomyces sp. NPDC097619 TaxID=3157228 RepID=UPI0033206346
MQEAPFTDLSATGSGRGPGAAPGGPGADAVPPPAPGADAYPSLDLVNSTLSLPGGRHLDLLATPGAANRWLTAHGLAPVDAGVQETCAAMLRDLREQVRMLFAARASGQPAPRPALAAVNGALARRPAAAQLRWDRERGPHREVPHPVTGVLEHALATLADDAADLLTGPDAERLTACGSAPCTRFLLRHGRRHWCSTRCGDRARAARAYARRTRGQEAPTAD